MVPSFVPNMFARVGKESSLRNRITPKVIETAGYL